VSNLFSGGLKIVHLGETRTTFFNLGLIEIPLVLEEYHGVSEKDGGGEYAFYSVR
jgi:hypothetical protein